MNNLPYDFYVFRVCDNNCPSGMKRSFGVATVDLKHHAYYSLDEINQQMMGGLRLLDINTAQQFSLPCIVASEFINAKNSVFYTFCVNSCYCMIRVNIDTQKAYYQHLEFSNNGCDFDLNSGDRRYVAKNYYFCEYINSRNKSPFRLDNEKYFLKVAKQLAIASFVFDFA